MKIRRITFENHNVYGNLSLDFTNNEGNAVDTIIIAGENGVGKSLLLNTIFELSNMTLSPLQRNETLKVEVELSLMDIELLKSNHQISNSSIAQSIGTIYVIVFDYNIINNWDQIKILPTSMDPTMRIPSAWVIGNEFKRIFKVIFSDVEINFSHRAVGSVTSSNIDSNANSQRSDSNLAEKIVQLLIDVQSIDALDFSEWARENRGQNIDENKLDVRMKRFTNAFSYMFPTKKYKKVATVDNKKKIIFEENGRQMPIEKLSSGEKQIVFRGGFLLKDKGSSLGSVILIDEPEISLHPNWQLKIMSFFKQLFTNDFGQQTSQIIVTTHSPFIIHNYNRNNDKVIILKKDSDGLITIANHPTFYTWSNEEFIKEAFNIENVFNDNATIVFLEGETDEKYYNLSLKIFGLIQHQIRFKWIGRINDRGQAENTGDTALNQAKTFFLANMQQLKSKTILFYDNDTNKQDENIANTLFVRSMLLNVSNTIFKKGVENLLTIIPELDVSRFYKERTKIDDYGAVSVIRELDKIELCNFICDELSEDKQQIVLALLKTEIEKLLQV